MPEIIGEYEISRKRISERLIEVQHFKQPVPFDCMQVAVGQCSDVGRRLSQRRVLPKRIAEHITLTCGYNDQNQNDYQVIFNIFSNNTVIPRERYSIRLFKEIYPNINEKRIDIKSRKNRLTLYT